jgi:hypothetical protein
MNHGGVTEPVKAVFGLAGPVSGSYHSQDPQIFYKKVLTLFYHFLSDL